MKNRRGFTLLELIIAVAIAIAVMSAVVNISSIVTRYHLQASNKVIVSGNAISALQEVTRELEAATFVRVPMPLGTSADWVQVCRNWSGQGSVSNPGGAGSLDGTGIGNVTAFCVDAAAGGTLYEWKGTGDCSAMPIVGLGCNNFGGMTRTVLYPGQTVTFSATSGVWRNPAFPSYFTSTMAGAGGDNGIEIHMWFGNPAATADGTGKPGLYVPQVYKIDTKFNMGKSFNGTNTFGG